MPEVCPIIFTSGENRLIGMVHQARGEGRDGVLIVVGGPQYRVGAHRQYVHLSRSLAEAGIHAMRFDYAGVGDSEGDFPGFEHADTDIRSAMAEMYRQLPNLENLYVWGLCDGASIALLHAAGSDSVAGMVLVNPWVWSEEAEDRTLARHYYGSRFRDVDFWWMLVRGKVNLAAAFGGFLKTVMRAIRPTLQTESRTNDITPYQGRMAAALKTYSGPIMLLLSGNDLVARDFEDRMQRDPAWKGATTSPLITTHHIQEADHTFSRNDWKKQVARITIEWIKACRSKDMAAETKTGHRS